MLACGVQKMYNREKTKGRRGNERIFSGAGAVYPSAGAVAGCDDAACVQNQWVGYRTRRAMQSEEAWAFAQKTAGRLWMAAGAAMLCVSAVLCVMVYPWMETAVIYFVLAQAALTLGTVPLTERALKRRFGASA